jgi:hypothetical protein
MPWRVGTRLNLHIVNIAKIAVRGKCLCSKIVRCIAQRKIDRSDEAFAAAEIADDACLLDRFSHGLLHQDCGSVEKLRQDGNQLRCWNGEVKYGVSGRICNCIGSGAESSFDALVQCEFFGPFPRFVEKADHREAGFLVRRQMRVANNATGPNYHDRANVLRARRLSLRNQCQQCGITLFSGWDCVHIDDPRIFACCIALKSR